MAIRLRLPIPYHKASRLILPSALLFAGIVIFICGLVRTYHISEVKTKSDQERRFVKTQNEHMEWWIGFPVMGSAILAMTAVMFDKPLLFKISVLATGACFVAIVYALVWDAGEFAWYASNMNYVLHLESEGYNCSTKETKYNSSGHEYTFRECECTNNKAHSHFELFIFYSCELLRSLYCLHAVLSFALSCAIGLSLFTLFSFVLILKRISQITTALHLDEKPLSEDFANIHGDLYCDS